VFAMTSIFTNKVYFFLNFDFSNIKPNWK
jgi:hypothetical protein